MYYVVVCTHADPPGLQTQQLRRTFAYGEVFMGMVMFLMFFLLLMWVAPFAPDYDMRTMHRTRSGVRLWQFARRLAGSYVCMARTAVVSVECHVPKG